jgi:hypothetical protein
MTLEEFRKEARHAYLLLNLYEMLRDDNGTALRERLARDSPDPYRDWPQGPFVQELFLANFASKRQLATTIYLTMIGYHRCAGRYSMNTSSEK